MSTVKAIALIAGREIRTRLLSKVTIISTSILLVVIVAGIGAASLFIGSDDPPFAGPSETEVGVAAETAGLTPLLQETATQIGVDLQVSEVGSDEGRAAVMDGEHAAYLSGSPEAPQMLVDGTPDVAVMQIVTDATERFVLAELVGDLGGDPEEAQAQLASAGPVVETVDASDLDPVQIAIAVVVTSLLLFALIQTSQLIAMGVVEEKVSRVVELLLSTVRPAVLMAGKVAGIGVVGLVQISLFAGAGALTAQLSGLLDGFDVSITASLGTLLLWFLLGFGLYSVVMAGVAALVSRQEDIGQVVTPVILFMMAGFYLGIFLVPTNPDSTLVRVLSQIPFFAPFMMPPRQAFDQVPAIETVVAVAGSLVLIPLLVWISGRIYSRAVLSTGGRMKLRDALRG